MFINIKTELMYNLFDYKRQWKTGKNIENGNR